MNWREKLKLVRLWRQLKVYPVEEILMGIACLIVAGLIAYALSSEFMQGKLVP